MNQRENSRRPSEGSVYEVLAVCGFLALAVGLIFGQTVRHDFINLDDAACVYLNPYVTNGFTLQEVKWVFTHRYSAGWMPMTLTTHMLDWQLYGDNAGGHHRTNVLLHAATAVLLFLVLRQMTGRLWPCAFAAAVFAVHPLRVESVAWVAERKDVLSGLFFVLALGAYSFYVRRRFSVVRYLLVAVFFALGLMAKPMLVTLPFVLLLLDYWPFDRWATATTRVLLEKIPLLAMTVAICGVAIWSYGSDGVNLLDQRYSLWWRLGNASISYVGYLGMFFYPVGLATPYPVPGPDLSLWKCFGAVLVLVALTLAALRWRRRCPYLLVGWLWYLGMLAPASGLLQFGMQTMADRFTYLPQIGLCIALAWGLADALKSLPYRRAACGVGAALALAVLMGCAWRQTTFWRNSETLWTHSLDCTSQNNVAHRALGDAYLGRGQIDKAIEQYQAALAIEPDASLHYNLGAALAGVERFDEAIAQYEKTLELRPNDGAAHNNLGKALLIRGRLDEGMQHCREALRLDPNFAEAHYNLGNALYFRGSFDEAIAEYSEALGTTPDFAEAHCRLGLALVARGRPDEAVVHFRKALAIRPDYVEARDNLDRVLAGQRRLR